MPYLHHAVQLKIKKYTTSQSPRSAMISGNRVVNVNDVTDLCHSDKVWPAAVRLLDDRDFSMFLLTFSRTHSIKQLKIWNSFQDKIVFALGFISHKLNSHAMVVFLITWGLASSLQTRYPACAEKHYICFQGMVPTKAWCWAPHESVVEVGQASSSIQLVEFEKMPVCDMLD